MSSRPILIIEPLEGLCNRMRVLDSAVAFSRKIQRPLKVIWRMDDRLNCPLSELFEYQDCLGEIEERPYGGLLPRLRRRFQVAGLQLTGGVYLHHTTVGEYRSRNQDFEDLKSYRRIYISTWEQFYPANDLYQNFVPVKALRSKIDGITLDKDNMVGVHVRRTDSEPSVERSPLWRFIELMEEERRLDPQVKFFLATDSPEEEEKLKAHFPDQVVCHSKTSLDRNDPRAAKDAVVDLYCLATCRKLIGSYWSSFTDTAWKLRGIDRVIVDTGAGESGP